MNAGNSSTCRPIITRAAWVFSPRNAIRNRSSPTNPTPSKAVTANAPHGALPVPRSSHRPSNARADAGTNRRLVQPAVHALFVARVHRVE